MEDSVHLVRLSANVPIGKPLKNLTIKRLLNE